MLQIRNLSKIYRTKGAADVRALDNVSVGFPETGMVFLLGKSGSGKSTLLNVVGGLDKYDGGEIIVKGKSSRSFSGSDFDSYRIQWIFSMIFTVIVVVILNTTIGSGLGISIVLLSFGIRQIALLAGIALLVAAIASFLPTRKISKINLSTLFRTGSKVKKIIYNRVRTVLEISLLRIP